MAAKLWWVVWQFCEKIVWHFSEMLWINFMLQVQTQLVPFWSGLTWNGGKTFCPFSRRSVSEAMYSIEEKKFSENIQRRQCIQLKDVFREHFHSEGAPQAPIIRSQLSRIPTAIISYLLSISFTISSKEGTSVSFTKSHSSSLGTLGTLQDHSYLLSIVL